MDELEYQIYLNAVFGNYELEDEHELIHLRDEHGHRVPGCSYTKPAPTEN